MPNLSVKLDEATRQRLLEVAAGQGITPHAFMIKAIGAELERQRRRQLLWHGH
jgi:predicted transcriptional regulator